MSEDDELSEDELNDLISDLESRSDEGAGSTGSTGGEALPEGEDLEAFLQEVEQDSGDAPEPSGRSGEATVTYAEEEEGPSLPELEELNKDQPPAETGSSEPEAGASDAASEGSEPSSEEESTGTEAGETEAEAASDDKTAGARTYLRYAWMGLKGIGFVVPVVACWWLLGAYLGQWVTAGWLILVLTTAIVFGLPKIAYDYSKKRGKYRWWLAGLSLAVTIGLVAPLSGAAGRALAGYGHWPGAAAAEITGTGGGVGAATGSLGEFFGRRLEPGLEKESVGLDLGSSRAEKVGAEK